MAYFRTKSSHQFKKPEGWDEHKREMEKISNGGERPGVWAGPGEGLLSILLPPCPLRPSSPSLLGMRLSPSCSLGTNRALSKSTEDMYGLPLSFRARCHSGLHTAGKESPAQPSVACVQSRWHWQIDVFIRMSLIAGAWMEVGAFFPQELSHRQILELFAGLKKCTLVCPD